MNVLLLVYRFCEGKNQLISYSNLFELLVHNGSPAICAEAPN